MRKASLYSGVFSCLQGVFHYKYPFRDIFPVITSFLYYWYFQDMAPGITAYRLKKLRRSYGLSQRNAAQLLGVTPAQLMQWEKGKRMPQGKNLYKLGALYKTLTEDIYYELRQEAVGEVRANIQRFGIELNKVRERPP